MKLGKTGNLKKRNRLLDRGVIDLIKCTVLIHINTIYL